MTWASFFRLADCWFIEPRCFHRVSICGHQFSSVKADSLNRIMALRLRIFVAFLLCCALTGAGVGLLEAFPVAAAAVVITCNALVGLVMFLVLFHKDPPAVESPESHLHWDPEIPRRGMGAVSYTHLTLPTKRIV